jgi:VanZ family protein
MLRLLKYWTPTFIWLGLIFYLSSRPNISTSTINFIDFGIKKFAHFVEYFILSTLLFYSLSNTTTKPIKKIAFTSLLCSTLYAMSDEFHQRFVTGRTPHIRDVFFDFLGALSAQLLLYKKFRYNKQA